jgi:hypothetical protein
MRRQDTGAEVESSTASFDQPSILKVTKMSEEALRTQDRRAFWYIVAICLLPLVPYALRG